MATMANAMHLPRNSTVELAEMTPACSSRGIHTISDLQDRVVDADVYQHLWNDWCDTLHEILALRRSRPSLYSDYNGNGDES